MGERHRDGLTNIERANKRLNIFMAKLIYLGCVCEEGRAGVSRVQAQLKTLHLKKYAFIWTSRLALANLYFEQGEETIGRVDCTNPAASVLQRMSIRFWPIRSSVSRTKRDF